MARVYSPVGEQRKGFHALAPRVATLAGKKIGLLWNSKANGDVYLREFREFVEENYQNVTFENFVKPGASVLISATDLKRARECDAVLTAFGDCGACSTWTCRDGVELELAGIPSAVVITQPFALKTRLEAESLGVGWLPLITLPHPVGYLEYDVAKKIFRDSFDDVLFALTADSSALIERYAREPVKVPA
jgi:hypothetical protein